MLRRLSRLAISALFGFAAFLTGVAAVALLTKPSHDEIERPLSEPAKHVELPSESLTQTDKPKVKKFNEPKVTQSAIIHFPRHGSVRVEAVNKSANFQKSCSPMLRVTHYSSKVQRKIRMVFLSQKPTPTLRSRFYAFAKYVPRGFNLRC